MQSLDVEENPGPRPGNGVNDHRADHQSRPTNSHLKVTSYNVRGLNDENKLRHLINYCYKTLGGKNQDSVYCFQETFIENPGKIPYLWRGNFYLTPGRGNSQGCLTLLSSHLNIVESRVIGDRGHVLACQKLGDPQMTYIIANIYAPNPNSTGKIEFFEKVLDVVSELETLYNCSKSLIMGDFNLTFCQAESKNRRFTSQEKNVSQAVKQMILDSNLKDVWDNSKNKSKFTWRRANSDSFSTIDRILYTFNSVELCASETNWSLSFSDHAAVEASFNLKNEQPPQHRSKITRLDPSVICDPTTRPIILEEINRLMGQAPQHWNPHTRLEYSKMCIRTVMEKAQSDRKILEKSEEEYLNIELDIAIKSLENEATAQRDRNELIEHVETLRLRKLTLIETKGKRLADKLGTKWYNEGEKSTKYFLRLMNRSNPDKFVNLENDAGIQLTDEADIESEIVSFYKKLYEEYDKENLNVVDDQSFFNNISSVAAEDGQMVSEPITVEELARTLTTCQDSAPGPDGIPYSIIRAVWSTFGPTLVEAWNYSLSIGKLPQSHKTSFLKLIPKLGKDGKKLTNWRPITLSNCDHKLITKVYASRMSEKVSKCIEERQTAYLKGRLINDNIRALLASINLANNETDVNSVIVSLDAKKAFDSVEHCYIEKVLAKFGLESFVPIFRVLYSELESDIIINGKIVKGFKIKRGVKQGDALSCVLFIMCMEPLLKNIETNDRIEGVRSSTLRCEIPKLYSYADDVTAVIRNDRASVQELFNEYSRLTNLSGLELNADKTEILPIKSPNVRLNLNNLEYVIHYGRSTHRIKPCTSAKINGIIFQQDENEMRNSNVASVIKKTEDQLKKWTRRNLCILGKILILKTFGVSQLIYLMQSMSLSEAIFKNIKHVLYKFIWNRHFLAAKAPERIKREIVNKSIKLGGLGMLDVEKLDNSLKLKALGRLKSTRHPMLSLLRDKLSLKEFFFVEDSARCDSVISEAVRLIRINRQSGWQDSNLDRSRQFVNYVKDINLRRIVSNNGINSLAFFAIRRTGVRKVADLTRNQLETIKCFMNRDLYRAIKETSAIVFPYQGGTDSSTDFSMIVKSKLSELSKLTSKEIRMALEGYEPITTFKIGINLTPTDSLSLSAQICKITNVRHKDMLLRLMHGEPYSKEKLNRYGLVDSPNCSRCLELETLTHKYLDCSYAKAIWDKCLQLTNKLRELINPQETNLDRIFCCKEPNRVILTIHCEILLRLRSLKDDVDHLLLPKIFVKNAISMVGKRELKREIKDQILALLEP